MELDFLAILFIFLAVSALITWLVKRYTKQDTYVLISMLRTKKPLAFFDRMAKHKKFLDTFATLGLIIGFGAVAIDFLYGRKLAIEKRAVLFLGSFSVLAGIFLLLDFLLGNAFSQNALIGPSYPLMVASFAFMGLSGFTLFSLFMQAADIILKYLVGSRSCPGVAPLIPGVEIPGVPITPPLHAWISLLIILLVHEGMHGILGRRHGFKIKSAGVLLFGFLPIGAFVEPDEKVVEKASEEKVLPFLAAGPTANLVTMFLTAIIVIGSIAMVMPLTNHLYPGLIDNYFSGVRINEVTQETSFCGSTYPSSAFGVLEKGDVIKQVNGVAIANSSSLYKALQENRFEQKTFVVQRGSEELEFTLTPNGLGQFGFMPEQIVNEEYEVPESYNYYAFAVGLFIDFFNWLMILSFLVAAVNFLPMNPFDGGRMARIIFAPYLPSKKSKKEKQEMVTKFFFTLIMVLLVINVLPLFF